MKNVYYGAAIQGAKDRTERIHIHKGIVEQVRSCGFHVMTEHTTQTNRDDVLKVLEKEFGPLPKDPKDTAIFTRNKMIECIERPDLAAVIFEVSVPSLGVGIELAHAYLRPRMGLPEIPILTLYQKDYWPNKLSVMISGITGDVVPKLILHEYSDVDHGQMIVKEFFSRHA